MLQAGCRSGGDNADRGRCRDAADRCADSRKVGEVCRGREVGFNRRMRRWDVLNNKMDDFIRRYGIYPLTAFAARQPPPQRPRAVSPETIESVKSVSPEPLEVETRKVVFIMCEIKPREDSCDLMVRRGRECGGLFADHC